MNCFASNGLSVTLRACFHEGKEEKGEEVFFSPLPSLDVGKCSPLFLAVHFDPFQKWGSRICFAFVPPPPTHAVAD